MLADGHGSILESRGIVERADRADDKVVTD